MTSAYDGLADRQRMPLGMKVKTPNTRDLLHLLDPQSQASLREHQHEVLLLCANDLRFRAGRRVSILVKEHFSLGHSPNCVMAPEGDAAAILVPATD